ncbi:MAG: DUF1501 domain-containing protein [Pseudomonadota bacterium]
MNRISRRKLLGLLGVSATAPIWLAHAAEAGQKKFVFVILRGALDGLAALIPDDPETEALRGALLPNRSERLDFGNGFRLHPALGSLRDLYVSGEAAFVHAAATPFRERSHFDGQDRLETLAPPGARDGWLNRTLAALGTEGLAVGVSVPLAFRGEAPVRNWSPPVFAPVSEDLEARLMDLYAGDTLLSETLAAAMAATDPDMGQTRRGRNQVYAQTLGALGRLMAEDGGANVAMASLDGWDTHANQTGMLNNRLAALDDAITALKDALGSDWSNTCVVMCSEFGRTAAANGTRGTDHGTGGLMILTGGAVAGGKVHGDWPGLKRNALYDGRDLAPANDVAAVLKGLLRDHLGLSKSALDQTILPGSGRPMDGLIST